jgi:hypothetical protein
MADDTNDDIEGAVELAAAIAGLRAALVSALEDSRKGPVRFRLEPVELTVQVGVTRTGSGTAGIRWHVLSLGGERSKQAATTQTLTLRLAPVLVDDSGQPLADTEQLIAGRDPK